MFKSSGGFKQLADNSMHLEMLRKYSEHIPAFGPTL